MATLIAFHTYSEKNYYEREKQLMGKVVSTLSNPWKDSPFTFLR